MDKKPSALTGFTLIAGLLVIGFAFGSIYGGWNSDRDAAMQCERYGQFQADGRRYSCERKGVVEEGE